MPNNLAETPQSEKPAKTGIPEPFFRETFDRKVSVAPMMDWTDRHCRYFLRGFSPRVLLYTEMITAAAVVHGERARLLRFSPEERPLALQLGGSDPVLLAQAARAGEQHGYDEINLNCGCPSDRVHAGAFGACLMLEPARVAEAVAAMRAAVTIPVTVKMRIGVLPGRGGSRPLGEFGEGEYARLRAFTAAVTSTGCRHFIVHAREAVLGGLSPKENREVPPLRFDVVQRLKHDYPQLWIGVNGGLRTLAQCREALAWSDGVMLGREVYHRPYALAELHAELYRDGWVVPSPQAVLERMAGYAEREVADGTRLSTITRHMLGLAAGQPGARRYRHWLSQGALAGSDAAGLLRQAMVYCGA
ncbi:MAG TPA: tRNA dihydrouridine(20/20a) synthase DusA [Steroidobacteraceae bacterium]|nr:tRNA dihydrouridine(20/20a) synthase DusA [Steroidobacteraceae bacterium]